MIPDFSFVVTDRDCRLGAAECWWCGAPVGSPHVPKIGPECQVFESRVRVRHHLAARSHLYAKHEATEPYDAEDHMSSRDAWIAQLKACGRYDRDLMLAEVEEQAPVVAKSVQTEARHRHLNAGWNGQGLKPSLAASIAEAFART